MTRTALVLGGGGITGIAWEIGILKGLHDAGLKIPAGVDVELMFTEGRLLMNRVLSDDSLDPRERDVVSGAAQAAADTTRPVEARLAALSSPRDS